MSKTIFLIPIEEKIMHLANVIWSWDKTDRETNDKSESNGR